MRFSGRFTNFALFSGLAIVMFSAGGCKGRTAENMEPTGDTIEVVVKSANSEEIKPQINKE
ncbi:MAG: hypothetical protein J1F12_03525 [Muribaculaceae bacterium]|nr:hypothetical protein [Muribaculaceae bacterium]